MPFKAATITRLETAEGYEIDWLLWVTARNKATDATETLGLWSGEDTEVITIDGQARTYVGALGLFTVNDLSFGSGTYIRNQSVQIGPLTDEVKAALALYDLRLAPAEIHCRVRFPDGIGDDIDRRFKGYIEKAPQPNPGFGTEPSANLELVSTARRGTRSPHVKKSDASQKVRSGDKFRQYGSIAGVVTIFWGEDRKTLEADKAGAVAGRTGRSTWGL